MAGGSWHAGCQLSTYQGGVWVWTFTVWQDFSSNGTSITRPVSAAYFTRSTRAGWDYYGTEYSPTQWWVHQYSELAAQKSYIFKQIVNGNVITTMTGWVQINVKANGTWSCTEV